MVHDPLWKKPKKRLIWRKAEEKRITDIIKENTQNERERGGFIIVFM